MRAKSIVVALCALIAAACGKNESTTAVPAAVETAQVKTMSTAAAVRYSATVEPEAQVAVAFRVGGYVDAVNVEEGDHVQKGAILARVRQSDYQHKYGQAAAAQSEAEAGFAQAKLDADRATTLFAANAMTKPEYDSAMARLDSMIARVNSGRGAAGEAGLALHDTNLIAPISGVILRRNIERGDLGSPGVTAFVLADTTTVKVKFGVPDTMVSTLHIGEPIAVATESMPDQTFNGKISRIAPAADPKSRAFDVEVKIANDANALKPGMVASLEIARGDKQVLAIPLASVMRSKSKDAYAVFVIDQNKVRSKVVDLGEPMGNLVAVRAGLNAGEEIVVSGPSLLTEGQPVRVLGGSYAQER